MRNSEIRTQNFLRRPTMVGGKFLGNSQFQQTPIFFEVYVLLPKATNLWFRYVSHAGVPARVQRFSWVFSMVIYITCHMITTEDS